jgi:zinc transport system permease protein
LADLLREPFLQRALLAGLFVGVTASAIGVYVVVRRAAFFGDALSHASLAGVAVGVLAGLPPLLTAGVVAVGIALGLRRLERGERLALDTILGFVLPFFLAVGIVLMSFTPGYQPELIAFLFGSILGVSWGNVIAIGGISVVVAALLIGFRRKLLFAAFDPDGARVQGIAVDRVYTLAYALLALVVIASLRVVGIVLVNALLVVPAATAKLVSGSMQRMLWLAPVFGTVAVLAGLAVSYAVDIPSGPAIVLVTGILFLAIWGGTRSPFRGRRAGRRS